MQTQGRDDTGVANQRAHNGNRNGQYWETSTLAIPSHLLGQFPLPLCDINVGIPIQAQVDSHNVQLQAHAAAIRHLTLAFLASIGSGRLFPESSSLAISHLLRR